MASRSIHKLKLIGVILGVVLAGYAFGSALDWLRLPGVELDATSSLRALATDSAAPSIGATSAPLTVMVFTDYQCGICRIDHAGIDAVIGADPRVRFVFKEWAILGPASQDAARVALAADYQGRYREVRNALMTGGRPTSENLRKAAIAGGADWARLEGDLAAHRQAINAELARTSRQAFALGLQGTPSYLVGNTLVIGRLPEQKLRRLIARALERL